MFLNNFYHGKYPNILSYSTGMIRRRILDDFSGKIPNTLQKKTTVVSDFDFYFRIIQKERIYAINEPLVGYRIHENNITKDDGRIIRDLESLMRIYIRDGIIPQQHASYIFSKIAILHSSNSILQGRKKESLKYIAQSLSYFPRFFWKNTLRNFIANPTAPENYIHVFTPPIMSITILSATYADRRHILEKTLPLWESLPSVQRIILIDNGSFYSVKEFVEFGGFKKTQVYSFTENK